MAFIGLMLDVPALQQSLSSEAAFTAFHSLPNAEDMKQTKSRSRSVSLRPVKATRWKKDQGRISTLESRADEKKALTEAAEKENKLLRVKAAAQQHVLEAREKQIAILQAYHRQCGPPSSAGGADTSDMGRRHSAGGATDRAARDVHDAATASLSVIVSGRIRSGSQEEDGDSILSWVIVIPVVIARMHAYVAYVCMAACLCSQSTLNAPSN